MFRVQSLHIVLCVCAGVLAICSPVFCDEMTFFFKGPTVSRFSQLFRGSVMRRCVKVCICDQCLQEFFVLLVYLVSERNNLIPMELF